MNPAVPLSREREAGVAADQALAILLVVDGRYPSTGGAEIQVRLLARALASVGHRVEIVAPLLVAGMPRWEILDGVAVTRLAYPRIRQLGALYLCGKFACWIWRRRHEFDAIHVHMAKNLAAVAGLLRPFLRATLTVKISGAWEFTGGILDPATQRRVLYRLYNWCIRRADCMQCISGYTIGRLAEAGYPDNILRLIPNAVDLSRFSVAEGTRPRDGKQARVVFVGRVEPVKGLAVLLDAWAQSGLGERAHLTVAGDGTQRGILMRSAQDKGIGASVEFPGEVRNVPELLGTAHIYVQPSYQEGLSNAVLEAMAAGLPIVGTRISGNEDVVTDGDNGLLVPPGDAAALADALCQLVENPQLAARMGARSRARAEERFSVPAIVGKLERAYRGLPA